MTETPRRRAADRSSPVLLGLGVVIILADIALAGFTDTDRWVLLGFAALGGVLIPHSRVVPVLVQAIAAWRGRAVEPPVDGPGE